MTRIVCVFLLFLLVTACEGLDEGAACGPTRAVVERVIDGDTVVLTDGERVRTLLIDAPETTGGKNECFGDEATQFKADLVLGRKVELVYDQECRDSFGRLLAYINVGDRDVSELLVERGYACVLHIPPNGDDRVEHLDELEAAARDARRGMWGACMEVPCAS